MITTGVPRHCLVSPGCRVAPGKSSDLGGWVQGMFSSLFLHYFHSLTQTLLCHFFLIAPSFNTIDLLCVCLWALYVCALYTREEAVLPSERMHRRTDLGDSFVTPPGSSWVGLITWWAPLRSTLSPVWRFRGHRGLLPWPSPGGPSPGGALWSLPFIFSASLHPRPPLPAPPYAFSSSAAPL